MMKTVRTGLTERDVPNNAEAAYMVKPVITSVADVSSVVTPDGRKQMNLVRMVPLDNIVFISARGIVITMSRATQKMERVRSVHRDGSVNFVTQPGNVQTKK